MKKIFLIIILLFKNNSLLRILQIIETKKLFLKGQSLEFGASINYKKNFSYFAKGKSNFHYSNIDNKKNRSFIKIDLRSGIRIFFAADQLYNLNLRVASVIIKRHYSN